MTHSVEFHPAARTDLLDLYGYIEGQSGPQRAGEYIARIERVCGGLAEFPERGAPRDHLAPGIRTIVMERRVVIAFRVMTDSVRILRVLYAGRDFGPGDVPH